VILEAVLWAIMGLADLIDSLVPPFTWPAWLFAPGNWLEDTGTYSATGGSAFDGVFVWVSPIAIDIAILRYGIEIALWLVKRVASLIGLATGGGTQGLAPGGQ